MVKYKVVLGKNLGLSIIAEGVETEQQVEILVDHQCYVHQGYYFSRPVSYEAVLALLSDPDAINSKAINQKLASILIPSVL